MFLENQVEISLFEDRSFMNDLFPFFILINRELIIEKVGHSIEKIEFTKKGDHLFKRITIERPMHINSFEELVRQKEALFIISKQISEGNEKKLKLRGQMYYSKSNNKICFLGSPLVSAFEELNEVGLELNDFALHDNITQFLFTLQAQRTTMKDTIKVTEKLKTSNIRLKKINESMDGFIYKLTHDLRAPALNIKGMLNMLEKPMQQIGNRGNLIFGNAKKATDNLLKTIDDFLALSKAEKEGKREPESCDLSVVLGKIEKTINEIIIESNARITTVIKQNEVFFTPDDLSSILQNLIVNAIKYKSEDRPLQITIMSTFESNYVKIDVIDNGIGIDLETQGNKIFKMFSRLNTIRNIEGTGVGLYLVKKLTEKNGAIITVKSEPEKGSIFTLMVPTKD